MYLGPHLLAYCLVFLLIPVPIPSSLEVGMVLCCVFLARFREKKKEFFHFAGSQFHRNYLIPYFSVS